MSNMTAMKSVILCEGKDDALFLAYYLYKTAGWSIIKDQEVKKIWQNAVIPCDIKGQEVFYMKNPSLPHKLAIKSTSGQANFKSSVQDIRHLNDSTPHDPIHNLIIFRDCDDRSDEKLLREMNSWFDNAVSLQNNVICSFLMNEEYEITLHILPLIIPFDEPGAIETLLVQAIADTGDEGKFIVNHARKFIETAKHQVTHYLQSQREVTKAKYAAAMAIYDPTHSRDTFSQMMLSTPWESSASIHRHMVKVLQMISNRESAF